MDQKWVKPLKKGLFRVGTTLVKGKTVKKSITYKEITLAVGIVVAMLMAFSLWAGKSGSKSDSHSFSQPQITISHAVQILAHTAIEVIR